MADPTFKPAAASLTLRSAAAMALAFCLARFSPDLPPGAAHDAAGAVVDLMFALGALGVGVGRARAQTPLG